MKESIRGLKTVKKKNEALRRPAKPLRDQLRRDQIVTAAQHCVVRYGFHAASMSDIAKQAQMSVGQIYRYFANKEAIVHAIVERMVAKRMKWIDGSRGGIDIATAMVKRLLGDMPGDAHDQVLLLEITAEATRNPAVAHIVREADRRLHAKAVATTKDNHPELSDKTAAARVEFLAVLIEGAMFRRLTQQQTGKATLAALYGDVLKLVFERENAAPASKRRPRVENRH